MFEAGNYHDMPLPAFVRLAYAYGTKNTWEKNRKSPTWEFQRYLKAHRNFDDLEPYEALSDILHFVDLSEDEQMSILDEWDKIKAPVGFGPLEWAHKMAITCPLKNPPGPRLDLYITFVSMAGYLQAGREKPIMLPVDKLAPILGTKARTVSNLRSEAQRQGILEKVLPHIPMRRATEFRFAVEKFPELRERQ